MPLRPYQEEALAKVSASWRGGARSVLLVSPTGSGKTATAVEAALRAVKRGKKVLWLAHRRELIGQASKRITAEGLSDHGIILAGAKGGNLSAPVQVASVDTLRARGLRPPADLVVWDEAHHTKAASWEEIHSSYPEAYHAGLTATPCRADGAALGDVFDSLVVAISVAELTQLGFLVPCDVEAPAAKLSAQEIAQDPVALWQKRCPGKKTVLYTNAVQEAHYLAQRFCSLGTPAAAIDGNTPTEERDLVLARFAAGELRVITNVAVLTEGWDCPDAEVCLVARSVGHEGLWLQMVGRVLRPAPGKERALVLDLAGNVHQHGLPEDPREFSLEGKGIRKASKVALQVCPMCGAARRFYPCARCGYEPQRASLSVTHEELKRIERPGKLTDKEERAVLASLTQQAVERNYKPAWVARQFAKRYHYEISNPRFTAVRKSYNALLAERFGEGHPNADSQRPGEAQRSLPLEKQHRPLSDAGW